MASPETSKPTPKSPLVQESPVFTYLSSLSPLKTAESSSSTQQYADTSCPLPEPVFTSPQFTRPREMTLKRLTGVERFSSGYDDIAATEFPGNMIVKQSGMQMVKLVPHILKKCSSDGPLVDQSCSSPSTCVDAFLADPSENCDDPLGTDEHCLKQVAEPAPDAQGDFAISVEDQLICHEEDFSQARPFTSNDTVECLASTGLPDLNTDQATALEETIEDISALDVNTCANTKAALSSSSPYLAEGEPAGEESSVRVHIVENENNLKMVDKVGVNERSLDAQLKPASKDIGVSADSSVKPASSIQFEWNPSLLDVMDHSSLMLEEEDVCHGKENPNNSNFCCQVVKDVKMHQVETVQLCGLDCSPQLRPESLQNTLPGVNHVDVSGALSNASSENHSPFDQEDGAQHQRGMRKRLQFETVEHCKVSAGYETNSLIFTTNVSNIESPVYSLGMDPVNASSKESTVTSNKQLLQPVSGNSLCRFSCKLDNYVRNKGSPPVTVPRTLGIGLHLNSIGGININVNMQLPENDSGVPGKNLLSDCDDQEPQYQQNCIASTNLTGRLSVQLTTSSDNFSPHSATENSEGKEQANQATKASYSCYQSSLDVKSLSSSLELKTIDQTPRSLKKRPSEDASGTESTQRSPKKKRQLKKAPENEGCKRCNCKRSKCLKLYCDCFAAGVFCSEACACQGCYNKHEHENTVLETRQLIESRNPLAFAPKVIVRASNAPKETGDSERVTPTSARHKRGCNCKKSLCLKKYCECFQAGVGCSLGCRCEGCRNTFGRKDGDEIIETRHEKNKEIESERDPCGNLESREVKKQIISIEHCYSRLTPLTPLFQGSKNDAAKSQLPAKYYPSPESGASISPSYESPSSPMDSISSNTFAKETEGTLSLITYNQRDPFSPGWDRFPDICNFSPLPPNPSPQGSSASAASRVREPKTVHAKLIHGNGRLSASSLCWHSSPVTPLPQLGEGKFVKEPDSDTPEILKDTCSPIKAVKASSPNQKRVSPPHKHLNEMRPSSSPVTRSGRKFILQSVPSFPPLTPYSNNTRRQDT